MNLRNQNKSLPYQHHLSNALERLFDDVGSSGFWDDHLRRIVERLYHDENWNWRYVPEEQFRYSVFCISSLLLAQRYNRLDLSRHEEKIRLHLGSVLMNLERMTLSDLTYGALLSIVLGQQLGYVNADEDVISEMLTDACDYSMNSFDNQMALVLIPTALFLSDHKSNSRTLHDKFVKLVSKYISAADDNGLFQTGDLRYLYHQRTMYVLWGLIHASTLVYQDEIYDVTKRSLNFIWNKRRQQGNDDAFIWHPKFYYVRNRVAFVPLPVVVSRSSRFLFECHQTFFANTVSFLNKIYGTELYLYESARALAWIFGENRVGLDLTRVTNLDIPCRMMTTDKHLFVAGENYKGSYEVGSYILALSFLA